MSQSMDFERVVADWLRLDGSPDVRSEVVDRAVESTRAMRQRRGLAAALVGPAPWPTYGRRSAKSVIADLGDHESEPSVWSPRGAYVYWSGQRGSPGQPQFDFGGFVSRADGGTPARLPLPSPASGVPGDLIWTPDESSVAFNDENGTWWVGNGDGTGFRQLTAVGTHWVAMSPDGRKFAFPFDPRPVIGATVATELGVGDGSSPPAAVTTLADGETAWSATWLPDGSGLAILVTAALADAGSPAATAAVELLDPDDLHVRGRFALPATGSARPLYTMQASPDARYVAVQWDDLKPLSAGQGFTPYLGGLAIVRLSDGLILPSPSQRLAEFTDPNGWTKVSLSDLVFSPDGSRAVLHIYGAFQVIDLDRTGSSRLTFDDVAPLGWSGQLVWTP